MFTGGLFWFVLGLIFVLVAAGAKVWAEDLKLQMTWWKWVLVALWYGLLNFTLAVPFTFLGENETQGATYLLVFLGVVTLILGVGLFTFLWSQREKAGVMKQEAEAVS